LMNRTMGVPQQPHRIIDPVSTLTARCGGAIWLHNGRKTEKPRIWLDYIPDLAIVKSLKNGGLS
jgi:trehalose-6-phosphatase